MKKGFGVKRIAFEISVLICLAILLPIVVVYALFFVLKDSFKRVDEHVNNYLEELFYGKENTKM